jgi:hypothetical protein
MSHTQLMVIDADGDVVGDQEYENGHGGPTCIWDALLRKYEPLIFPNHGFMNPAPSGLMGGWEALWKWASADLVRPWEWHCLQWSYDWALVRKEDLPELAKSMRAFAEALVIPTRVCHLPAIADRLDELAKRGDIRGAGLYGFSVSENLWWFRGNPEDELDEGRPYNIDRDDKHHFVDFSAALTAAQIATAMGSGL